MYHQLTKWYYLFMPTARRRYQVTETDDVARALDTAAQRWPGEPRSRLIVRIILTGGETLAQDAATESRLTAIRRLQGTYTDAYGPDYLRALRTDWPA